MKLSLVGTVIVLSVSWASAFPDLLVIEKNFHNISRIPNHILLIEKIIVL